MAERRPLRQNRRHENAEKVENADSALNFNATDERMHSKMSGEVPVLEALARDVRVFLFRQAAETARVPQAAEIAVALKRPEGEIREALKRLAAAKVLILAPNDGDIWAANPFCAVPSGFRVLADEKTYWGICIWDSLGIAAALGKDAVIRAPCGDCGEPMELRVEGERLARGEGVIHFAVPARRWWDNIGFT